MLQNISMLIFKSTGCTPLTLLIEKLLSFLSQILKDLMFKEKFYLCFLKLWVNEFDILRNVVWCSSFLTIVLLLNIFELFFLNLLFLLNVGI